jgi:lipopolysaccharide transport system ATP-binding protein
MSDAVIRVEGLGKEYRIGKREQYKTLRDTLNNTVTAPLRWLQSLGRSSRPVGRESSVDRFWALRGVSFDVQQGAVTGIIGRNGAGKSTLLKILSRITEPTEGQVELRGRVGSLLEVGTGFHPELTGRENIFLNGAILGMRKAEIVRRFDEIVAFAEVDRFVDTPVKHYSSGMYMRLAFAVAAHLEPEILIIDEVLAVGDAQFQKKCLGKMGEVAKQGRTVVFVSHNMLAVQSLCNFVVRLTAGSVTDQGLPAAVVGAYLRDDSTSEAAATWADMASAPGGEAARLRQVQVVTNGSIASRIPIEDPFEIRIGYWNLVPGSLLNVSLTLSTAAQVCVFSCISPPTVRDAGLFLESCTIPGALLNAGTYIVQIMLVRDTGTILLSVPDVVSFEVVESRRSVSWYGHWPGVVRPQLSWHSSEDVPSVPQSTDSFCAADR